jgi:hemerythrin superfamily protein
MDVLKLLKQDHDKVKQLFVELRSGSKRKALVEQLRAELLMHAKLEEEIFYPAIRDVMEKLEDEILEAYEEHHTVERSLADLVVTDISDERFIAKVSVLANIVLQHVEWEEKVLFPEVRKEMDASVRRELGEVMVAGRAEPTELARASMH